jgi:glycosyltransferase involved in cell wall biosynthesis
MNIGIYLKTLTPASPAGARFQKAVFEGLRGLDTPHYRYVVFSDAEPHGGSADDHIRYVRIAELTRRERWARQAKLAVGGAMRFGLRLIGAGQGGAHRAIGDWLAYEPPYYRQLREHNIRLIWNMSEHEMHSFVPFIKVVWDVNYRIHTMYPEYSYAKRGFDSNEAAISTVHRASYVIVGTEEGRRQLVDFYGVHAGKVRVVPFPTPQLAASQPTPDGGKRPRGEPYLFYPARFWPHKNHAVLIAALKVLRDRSGAAPRCVFSGLDEGNLDYVLRYAQSLGVQDQIDYVGNVPEAELSALYRNAAALVYCSAVGPDNLPPLEAMSLSCPVITADVPGAREQYGDAALFFPPTDEHQLADRIEELMGDPRLRATLVRRGLKRAEAWTADDYARAVVSIFDEFAPIARAWERCDTHVS